VTVDPHRRREFRGAVARSGEIVTIAEGSPGDVTEKRNLAPARATWPIVGSVIAHIVLVSGFGALALHSLSVKEARQAERRQLGGPGVIAIELPGVADGTEIADREVVPEGEVPKELGGAAIAHTDTGSPGRGGEATGKQATNLAAIDEQLKLDPDNVSHRERDQVQRLRTAQWRTTHEDRRATTHPMELTFLASGHGEHEERRPNSPADPARGSLHAPEAAVLGGHPGADITDDLPARGSSPGAAREGGLLGSPGVGVRDGTPGTDHHASARIAFARPSVTEAAPTIPGIWSGRPNDTVDSDQEVADTVKSLIAASTAGGRAGDGRGGSVGSEDPGAGGGAVGRASVARPLGTGEGDILDWNTNDPFLLPYFRKLHAKIDPLWANAFPKSAMLELKQGTVILEFTIAADGTARVTWPPVRTSSIDEFDKNCADAIRRASPFEPLPVAWREQGRTSLRIRAPFVAKNPIIK